MISSFVVGRVPEPLGERRAVPGHGHSRSMIVPVPSPPPQHIVIEAERAVGALELVQRGGDEAGAGRADRVADRDRAAVRVHLRHVGLAARAPTRARPTRTPR